MAEHDEFYRYHVPFDPKWTGGPIKLTLEIDEVEFGPGLIVHVEGNLDLEGRTFELSPIGDLTLPPGAAIETRFSLLANVDAARDLRDALDALIGDMEKVLEHGWDRLR